MINIKLVEAWEEKCGKCPVGFTCGTVAMRKCYINFLREQEKLINEQIAQAVKDAYRKGQQSIDTKANLPDAG